MEEKKVIVRTYQPKELAEKLDIKGEIVDAEMSYDEDIVVGVKLTIEEKQ